MKLQISEILKQLKDITGEGAVTRKAELLKKYDSPTLRVILRHAFDPNIAYNLPEGIPPYKKNDSPMEMTESSLYAETRKLSYLWLVPSESALEALTATQKDQLMVFVEEQTKNGDVLKEALQATRDAEDELKAAKEAIAAAKLRYERALQAHSQSRSTYNSAEYQCKVSDQKTERVRNEMLRANAALSNQKNALPPPSNFPRYRLEMLFIQLLESIHKDEAEVLLAAKNKTLTKLYPITKDVVKKAFPGLIPANS